MNENESITTWEVTEEKQARFTEEKTIVAEDKYEVASMDYADFLDLLMESRIIQAF